MAFYVRDEETDAAVRKLAKLSKKSLTEAIRDAVHAEFERQRNAVPLHKRLRPLVERYRTFPASGRDADKPFFDALSGDD